MYSNEMKTYICTKTYAYSSDICNCPKLETNQTLFSWEMDKPRTVSPYNEILLSNKRKQIVDTRNDLAESQVHCAKWKKPDCKGQILLSGVKG